MPFLGNAGQLTHIFVTTLGENNDNGDKNVSIDGAVKASDFKVQSSSLANISPTLQAVTEQDASSTITMQLSNPTTSLIASGEVIGKSFRGSGTNLTNIPSSAITGSLGTGSIGNLAITTGKLADNSVSEDKIIDAAVTTSKLADGSVTNSKFADNSISEVKVQNSAITTAKIADASITASKIAPGAVGTAFIGDQNVTTPKIANSAITTVKLGDASVTTAKLGDASVTTAKLGDASVTTAKLEDASVTVDKLENDSVTTAKLGDASVTTAKLGDASVTASKIVDGTITGTQIQDLSIPLGKLETTELTLGQIQNNEISGAKLQRHTITGGSSALVGDNRSEIALLTIHNDNIKNDTIDISKLNSTVTLAAITNKGATTGDVISLTNTTDASSKTTGSLILSGGVGVSGKVYATSFHGDGSALTGISSTLQAITENGATSDRVISLTEGTDASSQTTGTLKVTGGVGVSGKVYATSFHGDGSALTGISSTLQAITENGATSDRVISLTEGTDASSTTTGTLKVTGGVGVSGKVYATSFHGDGSALTGISSTLQAITEIGATSDQVISLTEGTDASSTTTGTLKVTGGVGVNGKVYATSFHGDGSALTGISSTLQAITTGGNSTSNKILITNNSATTTAQTGALQITNGGLYVSGNIITSSDLTVSGNLVVDGTRTVVNSTSLTVEDTIISLGEGNDSGTKDVGFLLCKPQSNVAMFWDTSTSKLKFGLTNGSAESQTISLTASSLPIEITGTVTATSFTGSLSGNASTATALETARTIGGVSFNGTANINLPGVNTAGNQNTSGNASTATQVNNSLTPGSYLTGSAFNGSAARTFAVDATTTNTASKIVARDAGGDIYIRYGYSSYLNMNHATATRSTDTIFYSSTDDFIRKNNATGFRASLNVPTRTGGNASGTWGINITGNAATATTAAACSGNAASATTAAACSGNSATATKVYSTGADATNSTHYLTFVNTHDNGNQSIYQDNGLTYNPSTQTLVATTFSGALSGNASSATTAAGCSGNAATASKVYSTGADATNSTHYLTFVNTHNNGNQSIYQDNGLTYNPSTQTLAATTFSGALSGNASSATTAAGCSGNAATATTATNQSGGTVSATTGTFSSSADSTSASTGAVQITGGLGVGKKIYAGDDITAFSDQRFKTDIKRIENALDKVCQVGGYTFDHRGERKTGVLAQEIKDVLPEAVYGSEETTYSVAYGNLVGILIEAIKELRNEIRQLK